MLMFKVHNTFICIIIAINCNILVAQSFSTMWDKFWSISCEFTDILSSSDRTRRSVPLEPNFEDPEELFNYLYPLADVKIEDYLADEMRSSHSLSTWLDDVIELWESECHSRKRRFERSTADDEVSEMDEDFAYTPYDNLRVHPSQKGQDVLANVTTTSTTTPTPSPPAEKKKEIPDGDTFFTQYGGDIEYFFPLLSFGIPFDGEITFLGFHGFKGLFPYR